MNQNHSSQSVLFIIDMIEGFVNEGPLHDSFILSIVPTIRRVSESFIQKGYPVIAVNDAHHNQSMEFKAFPPHCLTSSNESRFLSSLEHESILHLKKNSVNAFMSTPFQAWFKDAPVYQNYIICGCVTDICILHFALSLNSYFHEHDIDTKVSVLIDGVATYHVEFHDRETYHQSALNLMSQVGIHLIESESL